MMSVLNYLHLPVVTIILKMLILVSLLVWINRLQLHARNKALLWQIGLVFLVVLPILQIQFPAIQLSILPMMNSSQELVVSSMDKTVGTFSNQHADELPWFQLILLSIIVSLALLVSLIRQLINLHKVTIQAQPLTQKPVMQAIESTLPTFNLSKAPKILQSKHINTPCTWGVIRPVILLPADIKDSKTLKVVLLHELAHVQRKDWLCLMLSKFLVVLFWFNPLVWYVQRQMINSCESACDELVLKQQVPPSEYAETLLAFHQPFSAMQVMTSNMAQPSVMYQRLHHILTPRRKTMKKRNQSWLVASLLTAFILLSVAQLTAAQKEAVAEADLTAPVADAAPIPEAPPTAPSAPAAIPQPEHPPTTIKPVQPNKPVIPESPAPENMPQTRTPPAGTVMPEPPNHDISKPMPNLNRPNVEQLRAKKARMHSEQKRIRAEELALQAEAKQLKRHLAQLDLQKQRNLIKERDFQQLREKAALQRIESQRVAEKARIVRQKELENSPK